MEFFTWDQRFQTGLETIDRQHHQLVDILNEFITLLIRPQGATPQQVESVFAQLREYAIRHFADEEALMDSFRLDPRHLHYHRKQHEAYIAEVGRVYESVIQNPGSAGKLVAFLGQWLIHHILGCDQSMARQIEKIKAGVTPEQAFALVREANSGTSDSLLHALNQMLDELVERNRQLVEANELLEKRVGERTEDLRLANERLSDVVIRLEAEKAESQQLGAELLKANELLRTMVLTDVLTGLPNRRFAMDRMDELWSESVRHDCSFACILIDADGFKQVNDTYGHEAGDIVLHKLAGLLRASCRQEDAVCRLGGDEFLVLCPRTDLDGALSLASHLLEEANALRVPLGDGEWRGSLSLGVAVREEGLERPDEMIGAADKGLYLAKQRGRNQVATMLHA